MKAFLAIGEVIGKRSGPIAAIVCTGEVPTGKFPERTALEVAAKVSRLAVQDAGIDKSEIAVVMTTGAIYSRDLNSDLIFGREVEELGLNSTAHSTLQVMSGGASGSSMTKTASALVHAGLAKNVLCVHADKLGSGIAIDEAKGGHLLLIPCASACLSPALRSSVLSLTSSSALAGVWP